MSAAWFRAISLPTAALGLVAFFLPWMEVSCLGMRLVAFSGYEIASGEWWNKVPAEVQEKVLESARQQMTEESATSTEKRRSPVLEWRSSMLWAVAVACGVVFLFGLAGLPRGLCLLVCVPAMAAMSYFLVTNEQRFTDPKVTGGLLRVEWLYGFWLAGAALVVTTVAALIPRRQGEEAVERLDRDGR